MLGDRSALACADHDRRLRPVRLAVLALLCLMAACAPRGACDLAVTRDIAFTNAEARDTITARALGASCNRAIAVYAVHGEDGRPLWSWSAPIEHAFGDVFAADDSEAMADFLERWARPMLATTRDAPEWVLLAPGQTAFDRLTYEDIRARDLPMLCHFSAAASETCVFWEPAAGAAARLYDRDALTAPE